MPHVTSVGTAEDSPLDGPVDEESPLLRNERSSTRDDSRSGLKEDAVVRSAGSDGGDGNVPIPEEPSNPRLALILGTVYIGVFLAALDQTIIATVSGPISSTFQSLQLFSWIASAYLISNAAFQPLSGRLTDIFSRRSGLILSNILFALGNLMCGLATTKWVMIVGRVVAGAGGGGLNAIATFVGSDLVPLRKRGVVQGIGNICFGVGSGLGGVFGGWMNDVYSWRVAFLVQVPLIVVSAVMAFFFVHVPVKDARTAGWKRVDFLGALTLVAALISLLLGLNSGGSLVPWSHPLILTSLPLSALLLATFVYVEAHVASEPIIPVRLLLHRTVAAACLTNWFSTMAVFALIFYGPIYFQVLGLSTTAAGARLIPQSLGAAVSSLGTGLIMKATGKYWYLNVGVQICFVLSGALVSTLTLRTPAWPPFLYLFLGGFGYGGMLTITLLSLISAVDHAHQAVITSASYAFRSTGSTIGITLASAVFQNLLKARLWRTFEDHGDAAEVIRRIRHSFDEIRHLPPGWRDGVRESYMWALRGVFVTSLGLAVIGAAVSLFMREHVLHKTLARS
ncbi:MAG: hypothetical protein M1817_000473 [Caeruleum heppii]|nr:MAG: hypothetical protein M1817_000473 [Caeruleum heppii]